MLEAAGWGLLASSSLLIGAVLGARAGLRHALVGLILAFGAGTLVSAISFELTEEAYALGGADVVTIGLGAGALAFFFGDRLIAARDKRRRGRMMMSTEQRSRGRQRPDARRRARRSSGVGRDRHHAADRHGRRGPGAGRRLPLEPARGDRRGGRAATAAAASQCSRRGSSWSPPARWPQRSGSACSTAPPGNVIGLLQAFAAGGVLVLLVDEMIPSALEQGGNEAGLVATLGFAIAYLLSTM